MDKPKLYVLVGLSGSGKSTLAAQLAESNESIILQTYTKCSRCRLKQKSR